MLRVPAPATPGAQVPNMGGIPVFGQAGIFRGQQQQQFGGIGMWGMAQGWQQAQQQPPQQPRGS